MKAFVGQEIGKTEDLVTFSLRKYREFAPINT